MSDLPDVATVPDYGEPWDYDLARLQWERAVADALAGGGGGGGGGWTLLGSGDEPDDFFVDTALVVNGEQPVEFLAEWDTGFREAYLNLFVHGDDGSQGRVQFDVGTSPDGSDLFMAISAQASTYDPGHQLGGGGRLAWNTAVGDPALLRIEGAFTEQGDSPIVRIPAVGQSVAPFDVHAPSVLGTILRLGAGGFLGNYTADLSATGLTPVIPQQQRYRVVWFASSGTFTLHDSTNDVDLVFDVTNDETANQAVVDAAYGPGACVVDQNPNNFFLNYQGPAFDNVPVAVTLTASDTDGQVALDEMARGGWREGNGLLLVPVVANGYSAGFFLNTGTEGATGPWPTFLGDFLEISQAAIPDNAPEDRVRIFLRDNAGKGELVAIFPSGAAQVLATEP